MESLPHLDNVLSHLKDALTTSPADYTEIAWIGRKGSRATSSGPAKTETKVERTILVRVRERGRFGFHRADGGSPAGLSDAVRQALGQARVHPVVPLKRPPEAGKLPPLSRGQLFDPDLAGLEGKEARSRLSAPLARGETARLEWVEGRVAVLNSLGAERRARVTAATLFASSGQGAEAGVALASARRLDEELLRNVLEQARARQALKAMDTSGPEDLAGPLVLSPEASGALLAELGRLVSASLGHATAPALLAACLGASGASPLSIYDDGGDGDGLPFPFDLKGTAKKRLKLVEGGEVQPLPMGWASPPDQTGCFAAGGGETQLSNLFLAPGEAGDRDLLQEADGGIWISALRRLACHDPTRLRFRAQGRGLRRIQGGKLAHALPDRPVSGSLGELFGRVRLVGRERFSQSLGDGIFGGVTAPALLLGAAPSGTAEQ